MFRFAGKKKPFIFLIIPLFLIFILFLLTIDGKISRETFLRGTEFLILPAWIYGLHPAFVRTEKFFSKRNYANVVLEYEFIKKLLFVIIILLVIVLIIFYSNLFSQNNTLTNFDGEKTNLYLLITISGALAYIAIAAFLRITTQNLKREFRIYFAKACCTIISAKNDELEKMKYLFLLLSSYNKYLQRNLKIEINDMNKIYSIILYTNTNQQEEIIESICSSLEGDRFKLARYLSSLQKIPDSEFFTKESLFQQLKLIGAFLAGAIPIIISIIQLIFKG